jgi:hypothetical protein
MEAYSAEHYVLAVKLRRDKIASFDCTRFPRRRLTAVRDARHVTVP